MANNATLLAQRDACVARWEGRLRLFDGGAFDARSSIAQLPGMVAEAYPATPRETLETLTVGLCFFSDAIVGFDDIMDDRDPEDLARLPRFAILFSEAHRIFARTLPEGGPFWDLFRSYLIEYVDALDAERAIALGRRAWEDCGDEDALRIARGKNGLVRLVDAAIATLAGASVVNGAGDALLHCFVSDQMCDDLQDWQEDIRCRTISPLLRLACRSMPSSERTSEIAIAIYAQGHAATVLEIAQREAERAVAIASRLGARQLAAFARTRVARAQRLLEALSTP